MPDSTIAALSGAATLDGTETLYAVQAGGNVKATTLNIRNYVLATPVTVVGNATAGAEIRLVEDTDNGTNYVALKAPNTLAGNYTLTFPADDGNSGEVLSTDGSGVLSWVTAGGGSVAPLVLGTNLVEQRSTTNPQTFHVYNTYTDASNYERGTFKWSSNVLEIGTEEAGTGTPRDVRIKTITEVIRFKANSNSIDLVLEGNFNAGSAYGFRYNGVSLLGMGVYNGVTSMNAAASLGFTSNLNTTPDTALVYGGSAGVLEQRSDTTAQIQRIYSTYTDSTNYQRLGIVSARQTLASVSGASVVATNLIPDGALLVGITTRVTVALGTGNGTTGYQIGDGSDTDRWGTVTGTAIGTTTDNRDFTVTTAQFFTADQSVTITANGGNFNGTGTIQITAFYLRGEAD